MPLEKLRLPGKNKGFTLIECLVALLVLSLSLLMVTTILKQAPQVLERIEARKEQEWQIFLIQFEREVKDCQFVSVNRNEIKFKRTDGPEVKINYVNQVIRKQDNGGYQPLLTEVANVSFQQIESAIEFTVTFKNQEVRVGRWQIP